MKKFSSVLIMLLMAVAFVLTGCGTSIVMPSSDAKVFGNGGYVVQKGQYIYFTNAFTNYSNLSSGVSNGDKNKEFGIYRVKVSDTINATITYDENGYSKNVEKIVSKLSGFENSNLYIFGDYLFFSSPNMHKNNKNENKFDLISIFSVKLDGSGLKELYTTPSYTNGDWTVLTIENTNYLITREGQEIVRHTIAKNVLKDRTVIATDVVNAILPDNFTSNLDKTIFYTTNRTKVEQEEYGYTGNVLRKVNIHTKEKSSFNNPQGETVTLLTQQDGRIFYKKKTVAEQIENIFMFDGNAETQLTYYTDAANLFYLAQSDVLVYNSNSMLVMKEASKSPVALVSENVTPILVNGDYVYYTAESAIKRISVKDKQEQVVVEGTFETKKFDFDGRYIYLFNTLTDSSTETKYLQRIDTFAIEQGSEKVLRPVGFVLESDVKAIADAKAEREKQEAENEQ